MAPIGANDEFGPDYQLPVLRSRPHSDHPFVFDDQVIDLCRHFKLESGIMPCVLNDKIQKIPLWHEGNETAVRRQMGKICDLQKIVANLSAERSRFLVGAAQELRQEPEFVHDFERRGMDRIPAEVTQEIGMLFEDYDGDSGSGQKQP